MSIRFNLSSATNPIDFPSGDQNVPLPPSVPGNWRASRESKDRSHRDPSEDLAPAENTKNRPSGENDWAKKGKRNEFPVGGSKAKRTDRVSAAGLGHNAHAAVPTDTNARTAPTLHGTQRRAARDSACRLPSAVLRLSSAHFRSAADCQRWSGSFSRHRLSKRSNAAGATSAIEGAGRSRIAAITLAGLAPSNARRPVIIS